MSRTRSSSMSYNLLSWYSWMKPPTVRVLTGHVYVSRKAFGPCCSVYRCFAVINKVMCSATCCPARRKWRPEWPGSVANGVLQVRRLNMKGDAQLRTVSQRSMASETSVACSSAHLVIAPSHKLERESKDVLRLAVPGLFQTLAK
jgi:hypothetical protein